MRNKWTLYVPVLLLSMAIVLPSCQEENGLSQATAHKVGFYAGGLQTKTSILSNGLSAVWESGDELSVWARNSAGNFILNNQVFKSYGLDESRGFFTSTLTESMVEDTYTYLCCYPVPSAVNGTEVTFPISSVQDGKASGGVDVMIATPLQHGPLTDIPKPDDHSTMRMEMNRVMHHFRFYVPGEDNLLGDSRIERIQLTFPTNVVGNLTLDVEDPEASAVLTEGTSYVDMKLKTPIGVSSDEDYQFACLAISPVQFEAGQTLQIAAYTADKIAVFDPVDLKGKKCLPGHSTPVKLNIKEMIDFPFKLQFRVAANNLGEGVNEIKLTAPTGCDWDGSGSTVYTYRPGHKINAGEVIEFKFNYDEESLYRAFSGKDISVTYDSDHAIVYQTVNVGDAANNDSRTISLTVPYLFYEDFSTIADFGFDDVTGAQGTAVTGYDLSVANSSKNNVNPGLRAGWTGARTGGGAGKSIRVGSRVDRVAGYTHTYGRLDSPALSGLKPGMTTKIHISFNYSGGRDGNSGFSPRAVVGTTATSGAISGTSSSFSQDADNWNNISDYVLIPSISTDGSYNSVTQSMTHSISGCTSETRISWQIRGAGAGGFISNGNQWMFIDNIKVQIAN